MKYKSVCFISNESIRNMGNMQEYLRENCEYLVTFHYPHGYLPKAAYTDIYKKGIHQETITFPKVRIPNNTLKQFVYLMYVTYIFLRFVPRGSFVLSENPLFCLFTGPVSAMKRLRTVFWVGDYYPEAKGMFRVFTGMSDFLIRHHPYIAYASEPLRKKYESMLTIDPHVRLRQVIGLGIRKRFVSVRKKTDGKVMRLGFIGVIRKQQGLELVFSYLKHAQGVTLEVIGDGYWRPYYESLAKEAGVGSRVRFYGFVEDPDPIIRKWDVGLAPYEQGADMLSQYAEPTKIKDYLSYGLPVITTPTTYIARDVASFHAGEVIEETSASLSEAVSAIRKSYASYTGGVERMVSKYEYTRWYDRKFAFMVESS